MDLNAFIKKLRDHSEIESVSKIAEWNTIGRNKNVNPVSLYQVDGANMTSMLGIDYGENGFDVFLPATDSNRVDDTIKAICDRIKD